MNKVLKKLSVSNKTSIKSKEDSTNVSTYPVRSKVEGVHDPNFGVGVEDFVEIRFPVDQFHLEVFLVILEHESKMVSL